MKAATMSMVNIEIYTKSDCSYCHRAKKLLTNYNLIFKEISIDNDNDVKKIMVQRSRGRTTVPQIFINGEHIGGYDDLYYLAKKGELYSLNKISK